MFFCPCSLLPNRGWSLWGKVVFNAISVTPLHLWTVVLQLPAYRLKLISRASRTAVGRCGVLPSPGTERSSFPGGEVRGPLGTLWGGGCGFGTTNLPKFKHQWPWDLEPLFTEPGGTRSLRCWPCPCIVKRAVGKCCPGFYCTSLRILPGLGMFLGAWALQPNRGEVCFLDQEGSVVKHRAARRLLMKSEGKLLSCF